MLKAEMAKKPVKWNKENYKNDYKNDCITLRDGEVGEETNHNVRPRSLWCG